MSINENQARYIIRMMDSFRNDTLFSDATDEDVKIVKRMKVVYQDNGRWQAGAEAAFVFLVDFVQREGVPRGKYIHPADVVGRYTRNREVPKIIR